MTKPMSRRRDESEGMNVHDRSSRVLLFLISTCSLRLQVVIYLIIRLCEALPLPKHEAGVPVRV